MNANRESQKRVLITNFRQRGFDARNELLHENIYRRSGRVCYGNRLRNFYGGFRVRFLEIMGFIRFDSDLLWDISSI